MVSPELVADQVVMLPLGSRGVSKYAMYWAGVASAAELAQTSIPPIKNNMRASVVPPAADFIRDLPFDLLFMV
jgi:hypothetical protein